MSNYIQCKIVCEKQEDIRFIEEDLAKRGNKCTFKEIEGVWTIKEVYEDSKRKIEDINRSQVFRCFEYAGRKSYKEKNERNRNTNR